MQFSVIYLSKKIQISNSTKNTRMALIYHINQNVGFFIYNREFLFISDIIGSPLANNRFQILPTAKKFDLYFSVQFTILCTRPSSL